MIFVVCHGQMYEKRRPKSIVPKQGLRCGDTMSFSWYMVMLALLQCGLEFWRQSGRHLQDCVKQVAVHTPSPGPGLLFITLLY